MKTAYIYCPQCQKEVEPIHDGELWICPKHGTDTIMPRMPELHYSIKGAEKVYPPVSGLKNHYLYRAYCKCGFMCDAYSKSGTNNQMAGHIKTMEYLQNK